MTENLKKFSRTGVTLVELIMVMVIVGIVTASLMPFMIRVSDGWKLATRQNDLSEDSRIALDRMLREMRQVKDSASIISATSSSFNFIDSDDRNIAFSLSGSRLMRTVGATSNLLANNVSSLSFNYYLVSGTWTVSPAPANYPDIRRITINISFASGGATLNLESGVSPRRLQ